MAVGYVEEEEVWKCPKHPSKRNRNGICPSCLRDRLVSLCPYCANVRPCACAASTTTSSSSSSSSPSFRRSRSVAVPSFLRSHTHKAKTLSFFKRSKSKINYDEKIEDRVIAGENYESFGRSKRIEDFALMITRSRSVRETTSLSEITSGLRRADVTSSSGKGKGKFWQFLSPMKVFRSSKTDRFVVQDRSPLHRG